MYRSIYITITRSQFVTLYRSIYITITRSQFVTSYRSSKFVPLHGSRDPTAILSLLVTVCSPSGRDVSLSKILLNIYDSSHNSSCTSCTFLFAIAFTIPATFMVISHIIYYSVYLYARKACSDHASHASRAIVAQSVALRQYATK